MMKIYKVLSVNTAKNGQKQATKLEECGLLNHFIIGKKAVAKIKKHSENEATKMLVKLRLVVSQQPQGVLLLSKHKKYMCFLKKIL